MMRRRAVSCVGVVVLALGLPSGLALAQDNLLMNPEFAGLTGLVGGSMNLVSGGVPDSWRAFAVAGGQADLEIVPIDADELYPGSPATNGVLFRVNTFGGDQAFDHDNTRIPIIPGGDYHAEFYIRSANADGTDQTFNFGFPLFSTGGYLGVEPGGQTGNLVTEEWELFKAPTFTAPSNADNGHISWRCLQDGGEDAILIAMPSVMPESVIVYPTALSCTKAGTDVTLTWSNNQPYDSLLILRDDEDIASLDIAEVTYVDVDVPEGTHTYQVLAEFASVEDGPTCEVSVYTVEIGTLVSVELGETDVEEGLANTQRDVGSDGENEFVICGPDFDPREARSNLGTEDPTPDGIFYFNVLDAPMKAQSAYRLEVTIYDDPTKIGTGVYLQYTNSSSTGPGDIPNTFYPLDGSLVQTLQGTDDWIVLTWDISDAGFRSFQQGSSDFRLVVTDGSRLCIDRVDLFYFPLPTGLTCTRTASGVELAWESPGEYDAVRIVRDGALLDDLPGDATSYLDDELVEGDLVYQVVGLKDDLEGAVSCAVTVYVVAEGTSVGVDLGELDEEDGVANTQTADGTDGENEFTLCGPGDDLREARTNWGSDDPTFEFPDPFFYFNVTDVPMKAQSKLRIEATVYDDPARAGVGLALQYTRQGAVGPGDIENTFYPQAGAPVRLLEGTGAWVILAWDLEDAGFQSFQQGDSDFRLGVTDGGRLCVDRVDVIFPEEGPVETVFHRGDANSDGEINITDGIYILNFLFLGGETPPCLEAANPNDDAELNITDGIYLLNFLFLGGAAPAAPGPMESPCGPDPVDSPTNLGCEVYTGC